MSTTDDIASVINFELSLLWFGVTKPFEKFTQGCETTIILFLSPGFYSNFQKVPNRDSGNSTQALTIPALRHFFECCQNSSFALVS